MTFLTPAVLPIWVMLVSAVTFLLLRHFDPVDLNQYTEKMHGIPPAASCLFVLVPVVVLVVYDFLMRIGPKPARTGLKVY